MIRMFRNLLILLITLLIAPVYADNLSILRSDTTNLHWVAPGIYRSGQPTSAQLEELEKLGLRSVLNLRNHHSDDDEAKNTSLNLYRVRMKAGKLNNQKMIEALRIINSAPKPLLIHCLHGSDRTGAVVAMYRIVYEDWDKEIAIQELMQAEYGHHAWIYSNIPEYIRNADIEYIKKELSAE